MQRFLHFCCQPEQNQNMKPLRLGLLATLMIAFASCKKSNNTDCSLVPVKVLRYDCDRVILQVLGPDAIGDSSWTDTVSGETYTNVVSYYNTCEIASITNGELQMLYVKLQPTTEHLFPPDCVQCLALPMAPPQTMVKLTEISTTSCDEGAYLVSCH